MKKLLIIALGVLAIGATSCKKDVEIAPIKEDLTLQINDGDDDTSIDKGNLGTWD
jgi:hypothetical protein